jgi:uncharacterized protein
MKRTAVAASLGLAAGFIGGLFGVGGGTVMVPALVLWLGLSQHRAHATSTTAIIATASASLVQFARDGEVVWSSAGFVLIGALTGAYFGARFMARIPAEWLARGFFVLVMIAATRMWFS